MTCDCSKNSVRALEAFVVMLVLSVVSISCDENLAVFQVEANRGCISKEITMKRNDTFRVLIYSKTTDYTLNIKLPSDRAVAQLETRECGNHSVIIDKFNSSFFVNGEVLYYAVYVNGLYATSCNLTIKFSDAEGSSVLQRGVYYFRLCIAIGALFIIVFVVTIVIIVYYKKKYAREVRRIESLKENQDNNTKDRRRYSSPPQRRRTSNANNYPSDVYEVLDRKEEEPETTPPAVHNTLPRTRPRLPTPSAVNLHRPPHPKVDLPKVGAKLATPTDITAQDEYEEMEQDLLLTAKKSTLAPPGRHGCDVAGPARVVISELNKKLSKKTGPPTLPKTSRLQGLQGVNGPREEGPPAQQAAKTWQPSQPPKDVAPPIPNTPRPKQANLAGMKADKSRQNKPSPGASRNSDPTCSSDEDWNSFDALQQYHIYNV